MERRPGTPSLLRELNDRAALDLLLPGTPLTRTQISEQTRVSKVTVAQMLTRLEERGLVAVVGQQEGGRGPNAALYSVVPSSAYVAGLYVDMDVVSAGVADVTGRVVAEVSVNPAEAANPVELVRGAVDRACRTAGVEMSRLSAFVIGSPGVVNPRTGDPQLAVNLPDWHEGVLDSLRGALARPVIIENDVNLAALAERSAGAARDLDDFVLVWIGVGLGMAAFLGGKLHRGAVGAAGEIGYLPVPGAPLQEDVRHPANGGLQSLVGANVVRMLAGVFGFAAPTAEEAVSAAVQAAAVSSANGPALNGPALNGPALNGPALNGPALNGPALNGSGATVARAEEFLSEIARRVALGVASVSVVLDPGLVVLGGNVGLAGGSALADRVAAEVARICPASPRVVPTAVSGAPVLRGAMLAAVDQARGDLLDSV
jgi:predicted NBD/HSP70 family sugar kinase